MSHGLDRAYLTFDRWRSALVVAFASDSFFDHYNALTYGASATYRPDSATFRRGLFDWEEEAVRRFFPSPPARVLIGGAGGGREAFSFLEKGYNVVAFDPAEALVQAMRSRTPPGGGLRAYCGSYGTLPNLTGAPGQPDFSLMDEPSFDAAVIGWASLSHLRSDAACIETLRRFGELTRGPILLSYYPHPSPAHVASPVGGLKGWVKRRMERRGASAFSVQIGYYRLLRDVDIEALVSRTGLRVLWAQRGGSWPHLLVAGVGHGPQRSVSPPAAMSVTGPGRPSDNTAPTE